MGPPPPNTARGLDSEEPQSAGKVSLISTTSLWITLPRSRPLIDENSFWRTKEFNCLVLSFISKISIGEDSVTMNLRGWWNLIGTNYSIHWSCFWYKSRQKMCWWHWENWLKRTLHKINYEMSNSWAWCKMMDGYLDWRPSDVISRQIWWIEWKLELGDIKFEVSNTAQGSNIQWKTLQ